MNAVTKYHIREHYKSFYSLYYIYGRVSLKLYDLSLMAVIYLNVKYSEQIKEEQKMILDYSENI